MDQEKMGKFIAELRKEKGLTQYTLADLIPISRDAVSKWEQGKRCPDTLCLVKLSEIFDVSINEILYGERENKTNSEEINEVSVKLYEERNKVQKKYKKFIVISAVLFTLLIISFFTYYFISTYNSLKVYLVSYESDNLKIKDGVLVMTNDKMYFNLGSIDSTSEIKFIELFYKEKENKERLIFKTSGTDIIFTDFRGYNCYLDFNNIKFIVDNLYLKITYIDSITNTIKLKPYKYFSNDSLITKNEIKSTNEKPYLKTTLNELEKKIKSSFLCSNNFCNKSYKEYELKYIIDARILYIYSNKYELIYDLNNNSLIFKEYRDNEIINEYIINESKKSCEIGNCQNLEKEIDSFNEVINSIK